MSAEPCTGRYCLVWVNLKKLPTCSMRRVHGCRQRCGDGWVSWQGAPQLGGSMRNPWKPGGWTRRPGDKGWTPWTGITEMERSCRAPPQGAGSPRNRSWSPWTR